MSTDENGSVAELGLLAACLEAGITDIQVLTTMPHSSLMKAASIVGLGRSCVHSVGVSSEDLAFDLVKLENDLRRPAIASIVVISCAEVNTGLFATRTYEDVLALRSLCDQYGAWLHVDAGSATIFL